MKKFNKKGFSTATAVISGVISLIFLVTFAYLFITNLTSTTILPANSQGANATTQLVTNFTTGVSNVSNQIPSVMSLAAFILIISVLVIAYVFARKSGIFGGGGQLG